MSEEVAESTNERRDREYVIAWTGYIRGSIMALTAAGFGWLLFLILPTPAMVWWLLVFAWWVYAVLHIRSYRLYTNSEGVWVYSGVMPWNKGRFGVKWRDLGEAGFSTGFLAWLTRATTVIVTHRYTQGGEIEIVHVRNGRDAVEWINRRHREIIGTALQ